MANPIEYLDPSFIVEYSEDKVMPRNPYPMGYGPKIPSPYRLKLADNRWRRVWVVCYSNSGTAYVIVDKKPKYIQNTFFMYLKDRK